MHSGSTWVKVVRRTLMKLSPDLNFINDLRAAFTFIDPKSTKNVGEIKTLCVFKERVTTQEKIIGNYNRI